jgi:hypothetical protein
LKPINIESKRRNGLQGITNLRGGFGVRCRSVHVENRGFVSEILDEAKASWGWAWWGGEEGEVFGFGELRRLRGRERGESKGCRESRGCYGSCCGH